MIQVPPLYPSKRSFYAFDRPSDRPYWLQFEFNGQCGYEMWMKAGGVKVNWSDPGDFPGYYMLDGMFQAQGFGVYRIWRGRLAGPNDTTLRDNQEVPKEARNRLWNVVSGRF